MANKNIWIYVAVAVVAAYFLIPSFQTTVNGWFGTGTTTPTVTGTSLTGKCLEHDAITMTLGPVLKRYDPGNSVTPSTASNNVYDRVFINRIDKGLKADASTLTVTYGDKVEIYYAANSSDFYASKNAFDVPCVAAFDSAKLDVKDESKIVAYSNLTVTVFNADDALKNTQANNQTITANDMKTMDMTISFPGKAGIAPYGKAYINVRVNNTIFNSVALIGEGVGTATTSTYRAKQNASQDYVYYTFSIPGHDGLTTQKLTYQLQFDTSSSVPTTGLDPGTNASITVDDDNYYRNSETGAMVLGPADNTRTDVGSTIYSSAVSGSLEVYRVVFNI